MNPGLETRLRTLPGVTGIRIDLGRDGLEGIHVSIDQNCDESEVLDDIRRILVAYGLRSAGLGLPISGMPDSVWLGEVGGQTVARLRYGNRRFEGVGPLSWDGAAHACAVALANAEGRAIPDQVAAIRHRTDQVDLVVALVSLGEDMAAGVAISEHGLANALVSALHRAFDDLANRLSVDVVGS